MTSESLIARYWRYFSYWVLGSAIGVLIVALYMRWVLSLVFSGWVTP